MQGRRLQDTSPARHVTARDDRVTLSSLGIVAATLFTAATPIIDDVSAPTDTGSGSP